MNIGEFTIKAMAGHLTLINIDFTGSHLGPKSFQALKRLTNARYLQLINTNLSMEQIEELRKALPECKVVNKP